VLQVAVADRRSAHHQRAILDRLAYRFAPLGILKYFGSAHGGPRLAERWPIRIDQPKAREPEVAHGPSGRADIERIPGSNENHT
jgi:hypothetical protein